MDFYNKKGVVQRFIVGVRNLSILLCVVLVGIFFLLKVPSKPSMFSSVSDENPWSVESFLSATDPPSAVKKGYEIIITDYNTWIGSSTLSPNRLSCSNCHLKAGTQNGAASFLGVTRRYPKFSGRDGKVSDLVDRINGCMERSMNGKVLNREDPLMQAMLAYMDWLDKNYVSLENHRAGFLAISIPKRAVNVDNGKAIYLRACALCHGEEGKGSKIGNVYQYPPLWGREAYNEGAGMNRVLTAAAFIKSNMPYLKANWKKPLLTDEEAYDVAGYINSKERPPLKKKVNDYPDKKRKPVSTPYGPWEDDFSATQHKFGPFPPIVKYYEEQFGIEKNY
tara:strand:+ start:43655 stop:44662 length:1008 start_codon:yes stop_codon:yes gene_type:complete